jgi:hypothetical protein
LALLRNDTTLGMCFWKEAHYRTRECCDPSISIRSASDFPRRELLRAPPLPKAANDISTKETASSSTLMSQSAIVLYVPTPQMFDTGKQRHARELPENRRRTEVPGHVLAALVPSAGTMILQIECGSRAGAMRPCIRAQTRAPHRRAGQYRFKRHNDRPLLRQ